MAGGRIPAANPEKPGDFRYNAVAERFIKALGMQF